MTRNESIISLKVKHASGKSFQAPVLHTQRWWLKRLTAFWSRVPPYLEEVTEAVEDSCNCVQTTQGHHDRLQGARKTGHGLCERLDDVCLSECLPPQPKIPIILYTGCRLLVKLGMISELFLPMVSKLFPQQTRGHSYYDVYRLQVSQ